MSRTFQYNGATNLTGATRLDSFTFTSAAYRGEVGDGGFDFDDPGAAADLVGLRTFTASESASSPVKFFDGFIADRGIGRGPYRVDEDRQWQVGVVDINSTLDDILLRSLDADRPAETDVERVTWLLAATDAPLAGVGDSFVSTADPVDMDPRNYRSTHARDVLDECAEAGGKNFFLRDDGSGPNLHYRPTTDSISDPATGSLSNIAGEWDGDTVFGPAKTTGLQRNPERVYSGVEVGYGPDGLSVFVENGTTLSTYRKRETSLFDGAATTPEMATVIADQYLEAASTEEDQVECPIVLPAAKLGLYLEGQYVVTNFGHLGGSVGYQISRRTVAPAEGSADLYLVTLILTVPVKVTRFGGRGTAGPLGPKIACIYEPWNNSTEGGWGISYTAGGIVTTPSHHALFASTVSAPTAEYADITKTVTPTDADYAGLHQSFAISVPVRISDPPGPPDSESGERGITLTIDWGTGHIEVGIVVDALSTVIAGPSCVFDHYASTFTVSWLNPDTSTGTMFHQELDDSLADGSTRILNLAIASGLITASLGSFASLSSIDDGLGAAPASGPWDGGDISLAFHLNNGNFGTFPCPAGDPSYAEIEIGYIDISGTVLGAWCGRAGDLVPRESVAISDGVVDAYSTLLQYKPGSLRVLVDRIDWTSLVEETDPSTGAFTFLVIPHDGDTIEAVYNLGAP